MNLCFFKQKTAYELRIRAWSSGVCSSYLAADHLPALRAREVGVGDRGGDDRPANNGRGGQRNRGTVAGSGRDRRQDGSGEWILEARLPVVDRKSVVVGKKCVSTGRTWWSQAAEKKRHDNNEKDETR